jgi:branched-chain amino acid transport system substrate-binding protein
LRTAFPEFKKMPIKNLLSASFIVVGLLAPMAASAQQSTAPAEAEIRIGNLMPYTGALAAFAAIGRAQAAYFDMINERGGINGRKVKFISADSGSLKETAERTRELVEQEKVLLMFGSLGTPDNLSTRPYLNDRKIPHLFIASGDDEWAHPRSFPWTMGWQPPFRSEGRIFANYIQVAYAGRKIGVLWENDQFGRDLFRGFREGLGDTARLIVTDIAFDVDNNSIDGQIEILKDSGAEIVVFNGTPAVAARAIRKAAELDWHPVILLNNASASIASALRPAGLQNAVGVISTAFLKDAGDSMWKEDSAIKDWSAFMDKYYPDGDKDDGYAIYGYAAAETLVQVLTQCGGDLSRENIMKQAASLKDYRNSILLPGISINTGPRDFHPIKQMRLVQFDGNAWQPIGDVIEDAFIAPPGDN